MKRIIKSELQESVQGITCDALHEFQYQGRVSDWRCGYVSMTSLTSNYRVADLAGRCDFDHCLTEGL